MSQQKNDSQRGVTLRTGIMRRGVQIFIMIAFQAALLFLSSGDFAWGWGWFYIVLYLTGILANAIVMLRVSPETIAERSQARGMKSWDKVVGGLFAILYFIVMLIVAGLDVRYGWAGSLALWIHLGAVVVFSLAFELIIWAMASNAHFSTVVRIETERGHAVCDTGPYQYVRHPGYVCAILQSLAAPLILGSLWALIPGGLAAVMMVVRTALEDRTLQAELDGYREYAGRVRYRLLPGIW